MKVLEWKEMINELNDDDELCIARPSQDFGIVRINYNKPQIFKKSEIDKSWEFQEVNKFNHNNTDYVIY